MITGVQVPKEININIKVVNIGDCSDNVARCMMSSVRYIETISIDYNMSTLHISNTDRYIEFNKKDMHDLDTVRGCEISEIAVEAFRKNIIQILNGADIVFIVANIGDGTDLEAAQVIAKYAKEIGILSVGIVKKAINFDVNNIENTINNGFKEAVDTLIIIPNDFVLKYSERGCLTDNFCFFDDIICHSVKSITDLICIPGIVGIDFADVKTIMSNAGIALIGIGIAKGEDYARAAAEAAVKSLLLQASARSSKKILFNITGGRSMSLFDVETVYNIITEAVDPNANIIFGAVIDESLEDEIRVTVIATGFEKKNPSVPGGSPRTIYGGPQATIKNPEHHSSEQHNGSGLFKPSYKDNTEIPPWLRG